MSITRTIPLFLLFTLIIAALPATLQFSGNGDWLNHGFWTIFIFIATLTLAVLLLMLIVYEKNAEYFAQAFLGGTTLKILGCLIFILVFLADFFYIYLLNTSFEIYVLLRNLRHKNLR